MRQFFLPQLNLCSFLTRLKNQQFFWPTQKALQVSKSHKRCRTGVVLVVLLTLHKCHCQCELCERKPTSVTCVGQKVSVWSVWRKVHTTQFTKKCQCKLCERKFISVNCVGQKVSVWSVWRKVHTTVNKRRNNHTHCHASNYHVITYETNGLLKK